VQRALRLLEKVGSHRDGAPAKQLARETGLPLPTTYHLLRTLVHEGYLRRESGVFLLGEAVERLTGDEVLQNRRTKIVKHARAWHELLGAPVYVAVYRAGEVEVESVADSAGFPAVDAWADFRETAHAHAIGQCLLGQLDTAARQDHLDRHPVVPLTPFSKRTRGDVLARLAARDREREQAREREPRRGQVRDLVSGAATVVERQEYALDTLCAAVPFPAGQTPVAVAISVPRSREEQLLPTTLRLRREINTLLTSETFSISI
jgi:DNA-binding IclR family transcriptional regulator